MKTKMSQSKTGKSVMLTVYEGFSTYSVTIPMPYGVRFFAEGLLTCLSMLTEVSDLKNSFKEKDGEKAHIQEILRKSIKLYDEFLRK